MEIHALDPKPKVNFVPVKIVMIIVSIKNGAVGQDVVNNAVWVVQDKDLETIWKVKKILLVKKCREKLSLALKKCVLTNSTDWISSKWNSHHWCMLEVITLGKFDYGIKTEVYAWQDGLIGNFHISTRSGKNQDLLEKMLKIKSDLMIEILGKMTPTHWD